MLEVILIAAIVIFALPFLVLGMLAVFAGLSLTRFRQNMESVRPAQPDPDPLPREDSG
jgi:hypothetical protein